MPFCQQHRDAVHTQLGDYSGSALYRLGKRGHRFKCWECGVKKKAPCGDTHRPDLPWCCHRRLGVHIHCLSASFATDPATVQGEPRGEVNPQASAR